MGRVCVAIDGTASGEAAIDWARASPAATVTGELLTGQAPRATVGDTLLGSTSHYLLLSMTSPVAVVPS